MSKEQIDDGELKCECRLLSDYLPTGDWKYHNAKKMPLVEYELWNNTRKKITVTLTSKIDKYSSDLTHSPSLEPGEHIIFRQLPTLDDDMVRSLQENKPVQVIISVSHPLAEKPYIDYRPLHLMSYNTILWDIPDLAKEGARTFLLKHIVAWIDSHSESVKELWTVAFNSLKDYEGYPYPDSNDPAIPAKVVEAIFVTLRNNEKLRYDGATYKVDKLSKGENSQSVQRPGDTLKQGRGNCIDGAVLYASIMLEAGLDPMIVIQEGHAFVGWKTCKSNLWKKLTTADKKFDFLETTWTPNSTKSFQDACEEGQRRYGVILGKNWLNKRPFQRNGFACLLDIRELRARLGREEKTLFYREKVIDEPRKEQADILPDNITPLPETKDGSNKAQQSHLLAVSSYMMEVKQSLARIQPKISGSMTKNDCDYTIGIVNLIHRPKLPEVEIISEERQWAYKLDTLWNSVTRLRSGIEALRLRYSMANTSPGKLPLQSSDVQRSLTGPGIPALFRELVQQTEQIAGNLKIAMLPEVAGSKKSEVD